MVVSEHENGGFGELFGSARGSGRPAGRGGDFPGPHGTLDMRDRVHMLDKVCAYEADVCRAHHQSFARVPQRAVTLFEGVTGQLEALVLGDEQIRALTADQLLAHLDMVEGRLRELAADIEAAFQFKSLAPSRRPFVEAQAHRFRELSLGRTPQQYSGVINLDSARRTLLARRG